MEIFIVMQTEFFQGDPTEQQCIGVFSSQDLADELIYELQQEEIFDPMFRVVYNVIPATLDVPLELDDE